MFLISFDFKNDYMHVCFDWDFSVHISQAQIRFLFKLARLKMGKILGGVY